MIKKNLPIIIQYRDRYISIVQIYNITIVYNKSLK